MLTLGSLAFAAPWLLLGLLVLPILWLLLRAVPPAPIRRRFPGVALMLGLQDDQTEADKTPWWLLLLRLLAVAAVIIGFAGPVLNPQDRVAGTGPLLIIADGTWADARDWPRRVDRIEAALGEAARDGRAVALALLSEPPTGALAFQAAEVWNSRLAGLRPQPWGPNAERLSEWTEGWGPGGFETLWISDGLGGDWRADLLAALEGRGPVTLFESPRPLVGLRPARFDDGVVVASATRAAPGPDSALTITAHGRDPAGTERVLAQATLGFVEGATEAEVALALPPELRNRITRFELSGIRSAGAVSLTDDALRRREVALIAGRQDREGLELLAPTHFLEQALAPTADLIDGALDEILLANPDVIVLADVATVADPDALGDWVDQGGLLLRFAGPRVAASDVSRAEEDLLMPVRLRSGGRTVGGAMSWGEPKSLRAFAQGSPFFGLSIPTDVTVSAQVMAQPDPTLADRVIAALADGTPLVTRKRIGQGQVVLFHVTANAEWSTLPLSGLFVSMLERLAVSTRPSAPDAEDLAGTTWVPDTVLDAFGAVQDAGNLVGVAGEDLADGAPGPLLRPGLYAGDDRRIALNVLDAEAELIATSWPARIVVEGLEVLRETPLKGALLAAALALLALDVIASLWLAGRLTRPRAGRATAALLAGILAISFAGDGQAQTDDAAADIFALSATTEVVLAHVLTGDTRLDETARAGMQGLSDVLWRRTSIEPAMPIGVNLETDELAFFPFLYWPITADQPTPSAEAYGRLNAYLRSGGMILFDTRDADVAGFGAASANGRKLQELARPLDIPPLEPIPSDHVLTRTFYLIQDFPGRHLSRDVWVEAAPPDAEQIDGMPFRNLNDNVTPVVIGGNDWAAAWATSANGAALFPVGRGFAGERQREVAFRFGVNLLMHVLTGNYKSDQVHVPALLDRLGQ